MKYINEIPHLLFPSWNNHLQMSLNIVPCFTLELDFCCVYLVADFCLFTGQSRDISKVKGCIPRCEPLQKYFKVFSNLSHTVYSYQTQCEWNKWDMCVCVCKRLVHTSLCALNFVAWKVTSHALSHCPSVKVIIISSLQRNQPRIGEVTCLPQYQDQNLVQELKFSLFALPKTFLIHEHLKKNLLSQNF